MSPLTVTILLCLGTFAAALPSRIVGGEITSIDNYPGIVQVEFLGTWTNTWSQSCAANTLTSRWVLSAAHCFAGATYTAARRRIRAGTTFRNSGGVIVNILRAINHPTYGTNQYDGDVSVIELSGPLTFTPVIQPVSIVAPGFTAPTNLQVEHVGWGTTSSGGLTSNTLRDVTIYVIDHDLCTERYRNRNPSLAVTDNMICAGIVDVGGRDACQGDSGGPLYYGDILIGVVSWGHGCADAWFPGVSAAISPYTNWIVETVG